MSNKRKRTEAKRKKNAKRKKTHLYLKVCYWCGDTFRTTDSSKRYHSGKCQEASNIAAKKRQEEELDKKHQI